MEGACLCVCHPCFCALPCFSEGVFDLVVVDDEVVGFCVGLGVCCFACAGWSDDEVDVGWCCAPGVFACSVDAIVVAALAGGTKVVWVPPGSAGCDGDDVVDDGGVGGAAWCLDLAGVVVSGEDLFSDAGPGASVGGVCLVAHWFSCPRGG